MSNGSARSGMRWRWRSGSEFTIFWWTCSSGFGKLSGNVVISKENTPHGTVYYMTGTRDVLSHWDDEDNYHEKQIKIKENVRSSFKSREEAVKYAKKNGYKYLSL